MADGRRRTTLGWSYQSIKQFQLESFQDENDTIEVEQMHYRNIEVMHSIECDNPLRQLEKFKPCFGMRNKMWRDLLRETAAECLGTFLLALFAIGANAQRVLSSEQYGSYASCAAANTFGVMSAVALVGGVSGAQINPAVSFGMAMCGKLPFYKLPFYMIAQYVGAYLGSIIVYLDYQGALWYFAGDAKTIETAAIFTTFSPPWISTANAFCDSMANSAILLIGCLVLVDHRNTAPIKGAFPIFMGLIVCGLQVTFNYNTGSPNNPARDLAPRIFCLSFGWGSEVFSWEDYSWWWIPLVAPHVGAVIGCWVYLLFIELHHPPLDEEGFLNGNVPKLRRRSSERRQSVNSKVSELSVIHGP